MEDGKPLMEKVLSGEKAVSACDLETDFSLEDVITLMDKQVLKLDELPQSKVSELIMQGTVSYDDFPFENLAPQYQIRHLEAGMMDEREFRKKIKVANFRGGDWLRLLVHCHDLLDQAPWEKIKEEATPDEWVAAIVEYHDLLNYADIDDLFKKCSPEQNDKLDDAIDKNCFEMQDELDRAENQQADFLLEPQDDLEKAIMDKNYAEVVRLILTEHAVLTRPHVLGKLEFIHAPYPISSLIVYSCISDELMSGFNEFWDGHSCSVKTINKILEKLDKEVTKNISFLEKMLLEAIRNHNDKEILQMSDDISLSLSPYLLEVMPELLKLKKATVVSLFQKGIRGVMQPIFMQILMAECKKPNRLAKWSYQERLMYTNLMLHVITGEITSDDKELIDEDWYPMGSSEKRHVYHWYYDPHHQHDSTSGSAADYEKPNHIVRRPE